MLNNEQIIVIYVLFPYLFVSGKRILTLAESRTMRDSIRQRINRPQASVQLPQASVQSESQQSELRDSFFSFDYDSLATVISDSVINADSRLINIYSARYKKLYLAELQDSISDSIADNDALRISNLIENLIPLVARDARIRAYRAICGIPKFLPLLPTVSTGSSTVVSIIDSNNSCFVRVNGETIPYAVWLA